MSLNQNKSFYNYPAANVIRDDAVIIAHDPVLGDVNIRKDAFLTGASIPAPQRGYATVALMNAAVASYNNGDCVLVTNDPTPSNDGTWIKQSGAFLQSSFDRVAALEGRAATDEALLAARPSVAVLSKVGLSFETSRISAGIAGVTRPFISTFCGFASAFNYAGQSFDVVSVNVQVETPGTQLHLKIRSGAVFGAVICEAYTQAATSGVQFFILPRRLQSTDLTSGVFWLSVESVVNANRIMIPSITLTSANANTSTYNEQFLLAGQSWQNSSPAGSWSLVVNCYDSTVDADTLASVVSRMTAAEGSIVTLTGPTTSLVNQTSSFLKSTRAALPATAPLSQSFTGTPSGGSVVAGFYGWGVAMKFIANFDRIALQLITDAANLTIIVEIRDSNFTNVLSSATIQTGAIGAATYYAAFDKMITSSLLTGGVYYVSYHEVTGTHPVYQPTKSALSADVANQTTYPPYAINSATNWFTAESSIQYVPVFQVMCTTSQSSDLQLLPASALTATQATVTANNAAITALNGLMPTAHKNGRTAPITTANVITNTASTTFNANATYSVYNWQCQQNIATDKIINTISIPVVKDWFNATTLTQPILVRIAKNGVFFFSYTITTTMLAAYNTLTTGSPAASFDFYIEFPDMEFMPGDSLFVAWDCGTANKMSMLYGSVLGGVEGSEGLVAFSTSVTGAIAAMTTAPNLTSVQGFTLRVRSYYRRYISEAAMPGAAALPVIVPKKVYTVANDMGGLSFNSRGTAIPLYLDHFVQGLVAEPDIAFKESGKDLVFLFGPENLDDGATITPGPTTSITKTFNIVSAATYATNTITIEQKVTQESTGKTLFPKILAIGDSVTDGFLSNMNVPTNGPHQYWANIKNEFERARLDNGDNNAWHNCLMVGHKSISTWNLTYGTATNRALQACAEGYGGWSLSDQMFCCRSWGTKYSQGFWDLLGLGNGSGTDYINSGAQQQLCCTTPEGKYTPCNTAAFIAYINTNLGGSPANYAAAVALLNAAEASPLNAFYDKTVAAAGTLGFCLATYISRYKTLSSDGTTRLVVGSTTGSLVITATAWDVCVPTHIILQHSLNDGDVSWLGTNYRTLTNAIKAEYAANGWGSVCIGLSVTDHTGTYFPSKYADFDPDVALWNTSQASGHTQQFNNQNRLFSTYWVSSANEDTEKIFLLPSFHVQPAAWSTPFRQLPSPSNVYDGRNETMYKKMWSAAPDWHPNGIAHSVIGLEMYAWVKYTLSL